MTNDRFILLLDQAKDDLGVESRPQSYSGRNMYGRTCVGIVLDDACDVAALGAEMMLELANDGTIDEDGEALILLLKEVRSDNMGRSTIVYWPKVAWEGELADAIDNHDNEDDEEEE